MKKFLIILFLILAPLGWARADNSDGLPEKVFPARVTNILDSKIVTTPDGTTVPAQVLELKGLEGAYKDKIITWDSSQQEGDSKNVYQVGDKVSVEASFDDKGNVKYFIQDYVRTDSIEWLFIVFILTLLVVGRTKGLRAAVSLVASFFVIMKYILPQIMDGSDPIIVTLIGSFLILLTVIYVTEGFNKRSHVAVASIFVSLVLTLVLSWYFVDLAKLSGLSSEEAGFLTSFGGGIIDFKGLLLAGIIIGALGVLDDVVISQIAAVEEIYAADKSQTRRQIYKKAYSVGLSHISSMTNTLFLAYAGASLPLLILFLSGQSAFSSSWQAVNNESLATEIVRTLAGSVGLVLAVPISTLLAVWVEVKN